MKNDDFLDEKILELINQVEQPVSQSGNSAEPNTKERKPEERTIYTGIKIKDQWIEFEERSFVEDNITMMIPKEFELMEPEKVKLKYPMEQRPGTILTDHSGTVNLLFNYMEDKMTDQETEMVRDRLFGIMRRVNQGIKVQSTGTEVISGKNVAYAEFSNPVMDGKLYNLLFFLEINGRICMGIFNCRTKELKYWQNAAFEMMRSIRISNQNDEKEEREEHGNK